MIQILKDDIENFIGCRATLFEEEKILAQGVITDVVEDFLSIGGEGVMGIEFNDENYYLVGNDRKLVIYGKEPVRYEEYTDENREYPSRGTSE